MDNRKAIKFAVAYAVRKQLDDLVKDLKEECKPLEEYLLENLGKAGLGGFKIATSPDNKSVVQTHIDRIKKKVVAGIDEAAILGHTVYILRELWAGVNGKNMIKNEDGTERPVTWDDVNQVLEEVGMADLITHKPNTQTLSSHVRKDYERDELDMPILPPAMAEVIRVTEKFSVRMRSKSA